MKPKEIRELSTEEINQRIQDEEQELHQLRFQHTISQLEDAMLLRRKRREIARLKTILGQRRQVS